MLPFIQTLLLAFFFKVFVEIVVEIIFKVVVKSVVQVFEEFRVELSATGRSGGGLSLHGG